MTSSGNESPDCAGYGFSKLGADKPRRTKAPFLADGVSLTWQGGQAPRCIPPSERRTTEPSSAAKHPLRLAAEFRTIALRIPNGSNAATEPSPRISRSGSEKRQRRRVVLVRFDEREWAALETRAGHLELSFAAYLRQRALGDPGPRAKRRPPVDVAALGRAMAALNKAGGNLNQIARALNAGGRADLTPQQCETTLTEIRAAAAAIRESVDYKQRR
jgi:Bacterial mobilisation protein (MobC)